MRRSALFLAALLVLLSIALWWSQQQSSFISEERTGTLRVQPQSMTLAAQPDDFATLIFVVHNESFAPRTFSLRAEAPSGWSLLELPVEITLDAEQSQEIFLTAQIPPGTPPGRYLIALRAQDASDMAIGRTQLQIPAWERLKLTVPPEQPMLRLGAEHVTLVTVSNRGNVRLNVRISMTMAPAGWGFSLSSTSFSLAPGGAQSLELRLRAPERGLPAPAIFTLEALGGRVTERAIITVILAAP